MKLLIHYTTDHSDPDYVPATVCAKGETLDDLVPELSDLVATDLVKENHETVYVTNASDEDIDSSVAAILEAVHSGEDCIVITKVCDSRHTFKDVYTIRTI